MEFIHQLASMSTDELKAVSKDIMAFLRWALFDIILALLFTTSFIIFVAMGAWCAGWF
jgi:hypothetical protein